MGGFDSRCWGRCCRRCCRRCWERGSRFIGLLSWFCCITCSERYHVVIFFSGFRLLFCFNRRLFFCLLLGFSFCGLLLGSRLFFCLLLGSRLFFCLPLGFGSRLSLRFFFGLSLRLFFGSSLRFLLISLCLEHDGVIFQSNAGLELHAPMIVYFFVPKNPRVVRYTRARAGFVASKSTFVPSLWRPPW